MQDNYIVYVQTNLVGLITAINSSAFLDDINGWTQVDEGQGDKYHHAQGNYLDKGIFDESGCHNYKLVDGVAIETTPEEKTAELASFPAPTPMADEKMAAMEAKLDTIDGAFLDVLLNIIPTMGE